MIRVLVAMSRCVWLRCVCRGMAGVLAVTLFAGAVYPSRPPYPTNNNPANQIRFNTPAEADARRQQLVNFIWPTGLPTSALPAATEVPLQDTALNYNLNGINLSLAAGATKLNTRVFGMSNVSYLLTPANTANANRLVLIEPGHVTYGPNMMTAGTDNTANHLLAAGYSVVITTMPVCAWNQSSNSVTLPSGGTVTISGGGSSAAHDDMFNKLESTLGGGAMFRFFLEPAIQAINYFQTSHPGMEDVSMIGRSGGGWATHMLGAMDTRIKLSIPVAGSAPLYQWNAWNNAGDAEQIYTPLFREDIAPDGSGGGVATWLEIYALGGYGDGRREIMITNEYEPSGLFPGTYPDSFKGVVAGVVANDLQMGQWEHVYDTTHNQHIISPWAVDNVIMPAISTLQAPEPPTCALASIGLLGLGLYTWRKTRAGMRARTS